MSETWPVSMRAGLGLTTPSQYLERCLALSVGSAHLRSDWTGSEPSNVPGEQVIPIPPWILPQLLHLAVCLSPTDPKYSPGLGDEKMYSMALIPGTCPVSPALSLTLVSPFSQSLCPQPSHFSDTGRCEAQEGLCQAPQHLA